MSAEAILWADEDLPLDVTSKAILAKLAAVSDMEDCAWMCVAELAKRVGASVRTIQSRLRKLEGDESGPAYIRNTGRGHRFGTRNVPIYELLVDHDLVAEVQSRRKERKRSHAEVRSMGAAVCTHRSAAVDTICTPMGATVCTPKEDIRESGFANAHPERARASQADAEVVLAAWPEPFRQRSSVREVAKALAAEVRQGGNAARILAGCLAYAANRKAWGPDGGPMAPHKLIASGRWETSAPKADVGKGSAGKRTGFAVPQAIRAAFVADHGDAAAASYLDPCGWREADQVLLARTGAAQRWLIERGYRAERVEANG